jgi:hypothetical protein
MSHMLQVTPRLRLRAQIRTPSKIALHYCRRWFLVDLIATLPFELLGELFGFSSQGILTQFLRVNRPHAHLRSPPRLSVQVAYHHRAVCTSKASNCPSLLPGLSLHHRPL